MTWFNALFLKSPAEDPTWGGFSDDVVLQNVRSLPKFRIGTCLIVTTKRIKSCILQNSDRLLFYLLRSLYFLHFAKQIGADGCLDVCRYGDFLSHGGTIAGWFILENLIKLYWNEWFWSIAIVGNLQYVCVYFTRNSYIHPICNFIYIHWYIIYNYRERHLMYMYLHLFIYLHDMCNYFTIISTIRLQIQIHCLCLCNPTLITRWWFHKMEAIAHVWMIYIDLEVSNPWGLPPKSSISIGFPIINPGINPGWWFGTFFIFHFICGLSSVPLTNSYFSQG